MYSDINALRKAYYEFLSEDMSYSELQRSYDNINNNISECREATEDEIKLLNEKIDALKGEPEFYRELNKLELEKSLLNIKLKELIADSLLRRRSIANRKSHLETKLRSKFFKLLNHYSDRQLAIIYESIETAEKPLRIRGNGPASFGIEDEWTKWWKFANGFKQWMKNKDVFNQNKKLTLKQVLIAIFLLLMILIAITVLV